MPAKAAYIISHAGQKEVERSGLGETYDGGKATELGQEIGTFYDWLKARYPNASTILAGIIPRSSIGTNNTSD
jgi:hypothetical protein